MIHYRAELVSFHNKEFPISKILLRLLGKPIFVCYNSVYKLELGRESCLLYYIARNLFANQENICQSVNKNALSVSL